MADPLLRTKVSLPIMRHLLVPREKLFLELHKGLQEGHLLALVSAPAGYGKTTTIRMWVEQAGHPVAWVTLDQSDNDLKQFLRYVLTALLHAEENLGQLALEEVENSRKIDQQRVLNMLVQAIDALNRPVILVLEDYQVIENEMIDQFITGLLNQALTNLHLIVATREDPNLPLTRLRVRNQLTEIRAIDLSFSFSETSEFLSTVMGVQLTGSELELLKNQTEGWIAGLQLAALSLKESEDPKLFLQRFRGTHRHILHYLIDEVVANQPEEIREFLQHTAILDQLSPSLCEAVTGQVESNKYLHYLEDNNLFIVCLDEERIWYRYHALFSEFLKYQLQQNEPDLVDELHMRAAGWYQTKGYIQKAVEHAFQISDSSRLTNLIETNALPMLYRGEVSTVAGWFNRIPDSFLLTSPLMCIGKAWALALRLRQTNKEEVEQVLRLAEKALSFADADSDLRNLVAGHAASIQAYLIRSPALAEMEPEKVIASSQAAQQLLPENERGVRSVNALNIGYGYAALADVPAAENAFKQAFEEGIAGGNFYAAIYGPISLIILAMMKGQLKDALQLCVSNIERFNRLLAGQNFPPIGALYILKGSILLEQDQLMEAEQALTFGLSLERWTEEFRAHTKGYEALARLRSIQGDHPGMLAALNSLEETRPEGFLHAQSLRYRLLMHDRQASKSQLEEAYRWVTQPALAFEALPDITGLDPVSEVNFHTYLNVAYIMTRFSVNNTRAISLQGVHDYLARQEAFATGQELCSWLVEIWIVRALMYQMQRNIDNAHRKIQDALRMASQRGLFRLFLDESDLMRPLLRSVEPHLEDTHLLTYLESLLDALPREPITAMPELEVDDRLSERELEVLDLLAAGMTYKQVGEQLYLSLNTVQFHIKNIYGKLRVNKRDQAVNRAREKNII